MIHVANKRSGAAGVYVGRPSPLGNPFTHLTARSRADVQVGSREEALTRYAAWLDEQLTRSGPARRAYDQLLTQARAGDLTLICWCAPASCHADVLKARLTRDLGGDLT